MNNSNSKVFPENYPNCSRDNLNNQDYPISINDRTLKQSRIEINTPIEKKFQHWFYHPFESIYKKGDNSWLTSKFSLKNPLKIFRVWRSPEQIIGLRFGRETNYGLIDIDRGSPYHSIVPKVLILTLINTLRNQK